MCLHGQDWKLLFFLQLYKPEECIEFDATQKVPIDLLQPVPAVFYDYYEPGMFFFFLFYNIFTSFTGKISKLIIFS